MKKKATRMKVADIQANPNNPRSITKQKFIQLKQSIQDFPDMLELRPLVVDSDNVVLGGNMRLKALQDLAITTVPVIKASELTEEQRRQFIIKDNVGFGDWDWDILANEWDVDELNTWGLATPDVIDIANDDIYSNKIKAPLYEASKVQPEIDALYDDEKYQHFVQEIEGSDLPKPLKNFLKLASARHIVFYFDKIADYYSHCSPEQQDLFEKNALVIIDFDKAIRNAYVELQQAVYEQYDEDHG